MRIILIGLFNSLLGFRRCRGQRQLVHGVIQQHFSPERKVSDDVLEEHRLEGGESQVLQVGDRLVG